MLPSTVHRLNSMLQTLTCTAFLCALATPLLGASGQGALGQGSLVGQPPRTERAALIAPDGRPGDRFGSSVAIDGDLVAVGAEFDGTTAGPKAGSVYLYRREGFAWVFHSKLKASDSSNNNRFGISVAIDGDTLVVGSADRLGTMPRTGSAYVFRFDGTRWNEEVKLRANDPAAHTFFGRSVAIDGDTLLVGTSQDAAGAAYVFRFDGTGWNEEAKLKASDSVPLNAFGSSVSLFSDTAVVGAGSEDHAQPTWVDCNSGAAYIYERTGTMWTETTKLVSGDSRCQDFFGSSVSICAEYILVGAPRKDTGGVFRSGAAYVFERSGPAWIERQRLEGSPVLNVEFGRSVALDERVAAVGALFGPSTNAPGSGTAHLYTLVGGAWREQSSYAAAAGAQYDELGESVAVSGATLVAGAAHADPLGTDSGASFVFDTGAVFASFCDRDALAACPCGNAGSARGGCDTPSSNGGVTLEVLGQDSIQGRALLSATGFPEASLPTAVVVRGTTLDGPTTFGDGLRCIARPLTRLATAQAFEGTSLHTFGHSQGTGTFHYQVWYRSTPLVFCDPGAAYNVSNGVSLSW